MGSPQRPAGGHYLPGLNGLRFIAASIVVIHHAFLSVVKINLWHDMAAAILRRGAEAVDFFFTLSGFLITYLLLHEVARTGTVSLRRFYLRRMVRIWPLYYLVLFIGFVAFAGIYPRVYHEPYFDFRIATGLFLYLGFLPNVVMAWHKVGLLAPLWSIGIEEQFYLAWAPFVKWLGKRHTVTLIAGFILITTLTYSILSASRPITSDPHAAEFVRRLRFHFMAFGSLFGYVLYRYGDAYRRSALARTPFQLLVLGLILWHYLVGFPDSYGVWLDIGAALLYGCLILGVAASPKPVPSLEHPLLFHLGQISYGIYMYHMLSDYAVRASFVRLGLSAHESAVTAAAYGVAVLAVAVIIAHFSYRYMESYFLAVGHRQPATGRSVSRADAISATS